MPNKTKIPLWFKIVTTFVMTIAAIVTIYEGCNSNENEKAIIITGIVKAEKSGQPIENVKVKIEETGNREYTNSEGAFSIRLKGEGEHPYSFRFTHRDYKVLTITENINFNSLDSHPFIKGIRLSPLNNRQKTSEKPSPPVKANTYFNKNDYADIGEHEKPWGTARIVCLVK